MKKWMTVFPGFREEHINKDVGLIPIIMQQLFSFNSFILVDHNLDHIDNNIGCQIIELKSSNKISFAKYIVKNAKDIDVLNLYHFSLLETILYIFPYKCLNHKGKAYLKMDLSTKYMHNYTDNIIKLWLRKLVIKRYDLISVESSIVCNYINAYYNNKVIVIPNGFYWKSESSIVKKNNEILHVARLGAECKSSEILINAFEKSLNKHDWDLRLVGPMEKNFSEWYETKIRSNEELSRRIIYQGAVKDRNVIASLYENAKIFVLCSEYESFGIVLIEALSKGCFIIGTEGINPIRDIVVDKRIGDVCKTNNSDDLCDKISDAIRNKANFSQDNIIYRINYTKNKYSWQHICRNINLELYGE